VELPQGIVQLFAKVPQMPPRKKLPRISFIVKLSNNIKANSMRFYESVCHSSFVCITEGAGFFVKLFSLPYQVSNNWILNNFEIFLSSI
jgi:hypothetical protein